MEPELVADYSCLCGEGPLWHPLEKRLYWLDINTGRMFRYDPTANRHEQFYAGASVGGFTIQADGSLLLFMGQGAVRIWRDGQLSTVLEGIPEERLGTFNDVIADPVGRVFCGTVDFKGGSGRLYRLDPDGTHHRLLDGVLCSNGFGFTLDRRGLYYTDSFKREIYLFDYDAATGDISNQRLLVRTPEGEGVPDGMTVDAEGYLWSARWDGGCLVRYAPDGCEVQRVSFPAKQVSSVTFGGEDYSTLYITTAGGDNKAELGPGAGALFRIDLGIRGLPEFPSRIQL